MFNFEDQKRLTKDFILSKVTEEDIFEKYLGIRPEYGVMFCNPLRGDDTSPGANFNINKHNRIIFYDPGGHFQWDCFNVVEYLEKCTFKQAMVIVATDFGLLRGEKSNPTLSRAIRARDKIEIRIKVREWDKEDGKFWFGRYYMTRQDLAEMNIYPVSHAWYVRGGIMDHFYTERAGDPCYAYWFGGNDYKLYFPFRKKGEKFRQNRGDIVQGLSLLPPTGDFLIHTKSYKDVGCIRKFKHLIDVHSIATMSETQVLAPAIMADLQQRFKYHFTLFDFDRAGITLMRKYEAAYNTPALMFGVNYRRQGIKDFSDHLHIKRFDVTLELIKEVYNLVA